MGFSRVSVIIAVSHRDINVERASSAGKYRELYDFCEANRAAPGPSFWAHARPERYPIHELSSHREFPNNPDVPLWNRGAENMHIPDAQLTPINQIQDAPDISLIREEHIHHALVI